MEIIGKSNPSKEEYLMGRILSCFGMKKISSDKIKKVFDSEENK